MPVIYLLSFQPVSILRVPSAQIYRLESILPVQEPRYRLRNLRIEKNIDEGSACVFGCGELLLVMAVFREAFGYRGPTGPIFLGNKHRRVQA